jgi:hypothetical protein
MAGKVRELMIGLSAMSATLLGLQPITTQAASNTFHLEEASIADIQATIPGKRLTATELVKLYLARVKAYNGTCVTTSDESPGYQDKKNTLETTHKEWSLDIANRLQSRWALQQVALQCMTEMNLDALTYPTGDIPAPTQNAWTLGANGFPAITVPADFTTVVYDRVPDASSKDSTKLVDQFPQSYRWVSTFSDVLLMSRR